jgi:putative transposon-encoded protein
MSRIKPVRIKVGKELLLHPEEIYSAKVVKSGNGAVIKSYKKFIGRTATIIIDDNDEDYNSDMEDSSGDDGWKK